MKGTMLSTLLMFSFLLVSVLFAQEKPVYEINQLNDHIYKLTTDGGG